MKLFFFSSYTFHSISIVVSQSRRYFTTAQLMVNGFLTAQGIPPHSLFDPHRPSESLANLFDFIAREHLHTKISTIVYVKPAVSYVKDLVKLGKARGLLQKFNATELSDKLTDTVNLEVFIIIFKSYHTVDIFSRDCIRANQYAHTITIFLPPHPSLCQLLFLVLSNLNTNQE